MKNSDEIAFKVRIDLNKDVFSGDDIRDVLNITFFQKSRFYDSWGIEIVESRKLEFDFWSEYDFKNYRVVNQSFNISNFEYWFNISKAEVGKDFNPT